MSFFWITAGVSKKSWSAGSPSGSGFSTLMANSSFATGEGKVSWWCRLVFASELETKSDSPSGPCRRMSPDRGVRHANGSWLWLCSQSKKQVWMSSSLSSACGESQRSLKYDHSLGLKCNCGQQMLSPGASGPAGGRRRPLWWRISLLWFSLWNVGRCSTSAPKVEESK